MLFGYEDPHFGTVNGVAQPVKFDGTRFAQGLNPPRHGEHTIAVLREVGLSDADIESLIARAIVKAADNGRITATLIGDDSSSSTFQP